MNVEGKNKKALCSFAKELKEMVTSGKKDDDLLCSSAKTSCYENAMKPENPCTVIDLLLCGNDRKGYWESLKKKVSDIQSIGGCVSSREKQSIIS